MAELPDRTAPIEVPVKITAPGGYPNPKLVDDAVAHAAAALEPRKVGDFGLAVVVPDSYDIHVTDVRQFEDSPRYREGHASFVGAASFSDYVNRYSDGGSLLYIADLYGRGASVLTSTVHVAEVVLDDHPPLAENDPHTVVAPGRRKFSATLVLKPTAAARRWGEVLEKWIDQEKLLDLIVDGVAEIVEPAAADLRELASDLHAIRTTEVQQVQRTGGEGKVVLSENVRLHSGPGNEVTFPETITIALAPFAGMPDRISGRLRVKAKVADSRVYFHLSAPFLDDAVADAVSDLAAELAERTGLTPLWRP